MKKNQKGFTLVELLAVIVILAVIILIAVNAVLPQMRKARRNSFVDEAINFAKAAETAYVSDSLQGAGKTCYNISELKGQYVSKNDADYSGKVVLTINGDEITKSVTMTDGKNFYVKDADPSNSNITVYDFGGSTKQDNTYDAWSALDADDKACPTASTGTTTNP